ncbi:MAG: hypothetical protein KKH28_05520 [Elusimicrobia bacterium]|nr:hypothetical protein [Elusimicrobiota bacterium]
MRLLFLGTAASEAFPALFCPCDNCEQARTSGGRSVRRRSSLLVDDDLVIDLGPDVVHAALECGLRLHRLRTVLITHAHADHFDPEVLRWRGPGFRVGELPPLAIYGPPQVAEAVAQLGDLEQLAVAATSVGAYQRFAVTGAQVWTFPARHGTREPLLYALERDGAKFLYACDTGEPQEEMWRALAEHQFDAIIMEETMAGEQSQDHTNLEQIAAYRLRVEKEGILKPAGRFIATHFSHRNNPSHESLSAILAQRRIEAAHDGMEVRLGSA